MNKKIILLVILVLSLTMIFAGCGNITTGIVNGDFSSYTKDGGFEGWSAYYDKDAAATFKRVPASSSDQNKEYGDYMKIEATKYGVNYLYQEVTLEQGATYRLSVDVKTPSAASGEKSKFRGAFVGFIEDADFAIDVRTSTQDRWIHEEKYFTPTTGKTLTLAVGIGHAEAGKAKGTASFDNIKLEKVDSVPTGAVVETVKYGGAKYSLADTNSTLFVVIGAMLSVIVVCAFMYVYRKTMSRDMLSSKKMLSSVAVFIYMMLVAFIIRFLLAIFTGGMVSEINSLINVALKFNSTEFGNILFASGTTLPAGMLYLLGAVNGIATGLHIGGDGLALLVRLPFILADLVAIYLLYSMVSTRAKEHTAVFVAGLYAVLPSVIMASTGWGMVISLVGCLLIGMYYCMLKKNYIGVNVLYVLALLFSNYVVLLLPLVLAFEINSFMRYNDSRLKIGLSALGSFVLFYCLPIPFVVNMMSKGQPFYYFTVMFKDLVASNVFTADAFNMYAIFGLNMAKVPHALDVLNYIFVVVLMIVTVLLYIKNRDRLNVILMSAFTLIAISTLSIRGSIELMVLGIVLLFVYAAIANSRRVYALVGGFSTLSFLNMALVMSNSGFISNQLNASKLVHFFATDASLIVFSIMAVAMTLYLGYVVFDVCFRERGVEIAPLDGKLKDDFKTRYELWRQRKNISHEEINNED